MKKHSQLKWLASLALGAGVLAAYGIHDAQAAYAALPADGTAGVVEQKEAQPLRWFTEKADAVGSSTPYGNNEKAGHYVQSGDARLYYEVYGKGTPVVVLHGGGVGTPYEMGCIIDELRKNHEVIVMSTRGHGRSEIGHSPLTYKQKGEDVLAVMDAAHVKKAMIVGFSDGAYSAYETAVLAPERVERIAAIGAGTLRKGYFSADIDVEALEKVDPAFFAQQKKLMPEPERWGVLHEGLHEILERHGSGQGNLWEDRMPRPSDRRGRRRPRTDGDDGRSGGSSEERTPPHRAESMAHGVPG